MIAGKPPDRTSFYGSSVIALRKTASLSMFLEFMPSATAALSLSIAFGITLCVLISVFVFHSEFRSLIYLF